MNGYRISYSFFFFNDTATTEIYTLSLHDALPIYARAGLRVGPGRPDRDHGRPRLRTDRQGPSDDRPDVGGAGVEPERARSEEHTSELQSQSNIVCRLLLEKKTRAAVPDTTFQAPP